MLITYLIIAGILGGAAIITVAFTVAYFMTLIDMKSNIQNRDTNGATKATVESVIGGAIGNARTVKVGLFKGSDRVGDVTIECSNGTSVKKYDTVYV